MKMKRWTGLLIACLLLAVLFVTLPEAKAVDPRCTIEIENGTPVVGKPLPIPQAYYSDHHFTRIPLQFSKGYMGTSYDYSFGEKEYWTGIRWDITHRLYGNNDYINVRHPEYNASVGYKHTIVMGFFLDFSDIHKKEDLLVLYDGVPLPSNRVLLYGSDPIRGLRISKTFDELTAPVPMESLSLTTAAPSVGASVPDTFEVPSDVHYQFDGIFWKDLTTRKELTSTNKFEYGHDYIATILLKPEEWYYFDPGDWKATINGKAADLIIRRNDQQLEVTYIYQAPRQITFLENGGTGAMNPVEVEKGAMYTLPPCGFTAPELYEFDKWNLGAPGEQVKITESTEIKALWKVKTAEQTDPGITEQLISLKLKGLKATASGAKAIKLSWTKLKKKDQKKVGKFVIEISTDKKFTKDVITKTVSAKKNSVTIKKLKPGKKYYIRIRAVKEEGNIRYVTKWFKKNITLTKK